MLATQHVEGAIAGLPVGQYRHQLLVMEEAAQIVQRGVDDPQMTPGCAYRGLGLVDGQFGAAFDADALAILVGQLPVLVRPAVDEIVPSSWLGWEGVPFLVK